MKVTKLVLGSSLILGSLVIGQIGAFAGETGDSARSTADVEYTVNTNPINPTDPTDPGNEIKPDPENPGTGNAGPLSIDYISNITFGQKVASGNAATYNAALSRVINKDDSAKPVPNYVQVTDNRGTISGWNLAVKQEGQFKNTKGSLLGAAELSLLNGTANSANAVVGAIPSTNKNIALKLNASGNGVNSTVMTATSGQGSGTWTTMFGKDTTEGADSVKLHVPANTKIEKGAYTTTLVWTLSTDAAQ